MTGPTSRPFASERRRARHRESLLPAMETMVSAHRCSSPAAARKEAPCGHGQRAGVHEGRRRRSKRVASPPRWHLLVRRAIPRSIPRNLQLKVQTALWWDLHRISAYSRAAGNAIPQPSHKHPTIDPAKTLYCALVKQGAALCSPRHILQLIGQSVPKRQRPEALMALDRGVGS